MNPFATLLLAVFLCAFCGAAPLHAADDPKPPSIVGTESDARLQSDGKGWRLDQAKINDSKRPRVLLIGDSILNGYLKTTVAALKGRAYVDAWVNPYNQSEHVNKLLAEVLANGPYDVVHFNMGLHGWQEGRIKPGTFEPLTKAYVEVIREKFPQAKIIWASSTPVTVKGQPADLDPEINPIIIEHNRMAAKVMTEMKVTVNDFYALLVDKRELASGDRFHWTGPAYQLLADEVVKSVIASLSAGADGFSALFNGKDLTGWDGDPKLWKVENGIVIGTCEGPDSLANNTFLIWRGGTVKDFELRATVRIVGDNNSGIQYRSRELPEVAPWVITGYQCDIHPAIEPTGMTYEEKGRGIFGLNGKNVMLDPDGARWQLSEHEPVKVDVSQWNEYTVIARGNHLIHQINGRVTSELIDHDEKGRALKGLLAIQLHRGNPNRVEIKDLRIKPLTDGKLIPFDPAKNPAEAKKIERPRTSRPQGTGPVVPASKK